MTLCPAGIAASEPSAQNASSFVAECASRFQFSLFIACQMPLKFGCPAMRAGRAAAPDCCAKLGAEPRTADATTAAKAIFLLSCMHNPLVVALRVDKPRIIGERHPVVIPTPYGRANTLTVSPATIATRCLPLRPA